MGYARANPDTIRGRPMPVIVYDPATGRDAFAVTMRKIAGMTYRFGIFTFDDRAAMLTRSDRPVALEPQPARALALLLSRAGEVVTRDELRAHLWGDDTHVDFDRGLAYCIGQLRTALGDSADNPRFIQTLPRRGFSFIAPVDARTNRIVRRSTFFVRRGDAENATANADERDANASPTTDATRDRRRRPRCVATAAVFVDRRRRRLVGGVAPARVPIVRSSRSPSSTTRPATPRASAPSRPSPTSSSSG